MSITVEMLIACGLTRDKAEVWSAQLLDWESMSDDALRWQQIASRLLTPDVPFAAHELLYRHNYTNFRQQQLPCPAWVPTGGEVAATHVAEWISALGLSNYEELHAWSATHPEEFANKLAGALSLRFRTPPARGCDSSAGVEQVRWYPQATMNIVESCFQADHQACAIVSGDDENHLAFLSYGQLKALTARVAGGLAKMGVRPGDRVAICMPMTPEAVAAFLGIVAAGCSAVTIADSFSANEMAVRIAITQPKCIFIQDQVFRNGKSHPLFEKIASQEELAAIVLRTCDSQPINLRSGDKYWEDFLAEDDVLHCIPCNPASETTVLFSSGTTGQPKAIPWDHVTPIKSASDAYFHQDVHPADIVCWPTNLGWMMGPWLVYASLINKASLALTSSIPTGRVFCEFVERADVTMLGLIPSIVSEWRKQNQTAGLDWTSIRLFSSTGECSNPSDMLWLMSRAGYRPVIEYCGGTEIGGGYIAGTLTKPAVPGVFSAKAMGVAWQLLNEDFQATTQGEVFLEPPAIGSSTRLLNRDHHEVYYADIPPGPQQQVLRRHGDQIEELLGGYYRAHGRIDDAMNLGGIKVSCVQIEELLSHHASVRELAAVSVPPPGGGPEQLIIFVVLHAEIDLQTFQLEMQQTIKTRLNPLFKIHKVEPVEKLPRTASNKVMRRELRNLYLSQRS